MTRRQTFLLLLLALFGLLIHAGTYYPFLSDDSLISLRYSQRLLEGRGLNWNDGEYVEGYSNLLWVLATSGLGLLGIDLIDAVRILALLSFGLVFLGITQVLWEQSARSFSAQSLALASLVSAASFAIWTVGGLEQPLFAACIALGLWGGSPLLEGRNFTQRRALSTGFAFACLCLTRPDGPLFVLAFALSLLALRRLSCLRERAVRMTFALPLIAVLGQLGFRLYYYGDYVPNTARIKLPASTSRVFEGLEYMAECLLSNGLYLFLALGAGMLLWRAERRRPVLVLCLLNMFLWSAYVIFVGGDIFPGSRHFLPLLIYCAVLIGLGVQELLDRGYLAKAWLPASFTAVLALYGLFQGHLRPNQAAKWERWEWDGIPMAQFIHAAWPTQTPLIAVEAAGSLPYFSGLPAIDMLGLNDRVIATSPRPKAEGWIGHDHGNADYVIDREPDLVLLGPPQGQAKPVFPGGKALVENEEFQREYRLVRFALPGHTDLHAHVWVRREGGAVGIQRKGARVRIPAYLFQQGDAPAGMAESGRLALRLDPAQKVSYSALELKKGAWRVKMHGSGPEPVLSLETPDRRLRREVKGGQFHLGSRGPWIIRLQAEASVALYEIELIFEPR